MGSEIKSKEFDRIFQKLVQRTCKEWEYEFPGPDYFKSVYERLPLGLQEIIAYGFSSGLIIDAGLSKSKSAGFRPVGVPEYKGPYSWFSRYNEEKQPWPNWEYYVQLSEYLRLYDAFKDKKVELRFEDDLMDIGIYREGNLWVCCEIKVESSQSKKLIRAIKTHQNAAELSLNDRGNDPLRKAKYIKKLKPQYFYLVSIGRRFEVRVEYPDNMQFKLVEDLVPFV